MGQRCCAGDVRAAEARSEADGDAPPVQAACAEAPADVIARVTLQVKELVIDLHNPQVDLDQPLDERDRLLVQYTWAMASQGGAEKLGTLLFEKVFELAPEAKRLFPFSFERGDSTYHQTQRHVMKVVDVLGIVVAGLNSLDALKTVLQDLGLRHVGYKVLPEHYAVVCEGLHHTLADALRGDATPCVKASWEKVLRFLQETMIGNHYALSPQSGECAEEEATVPKPEQADAEASAPQLEKVKLEEETAMPAAEAEASPQATPFLSETNGAPTPAASSPATSERGDKPKAHAPKAGKESKPEKKSRSSVRPSGTAKDTKKGKDKDTASTKPKANRLVSPASQPSLSRQASPSMSRCSTPNGSPGSKAKKMSSKVRKHFWQSLSDEERATQSTALVTAANSGNLLEVQRLYNAGVNVNADDPEGRAALRRAVQGGFKEVVEFLVETAGADVNAARSGQLGQDTALHFACQSGKLDMAVYLVKAGASITVKNKAGKMPADLSSNMALVAWMNGPSPQQTPAPTF